jgi:hypothetical protein
MLASPIHRAIWERISQSNDLVARGEERARERENDAAKRELGLPEEETVLEVRVPGVRQLWPVLLVTVIALVAATATSGLPGFACLGAGLGGLGWVTHVRHARRVFVTSHRVLTRRNRRWVVLQRRG